MKSSIYLSLIVFYERSLYHSFLFAFFFFTFFAFVNEAGFYLSDETLKLKKIAVLNRCKFVLGENLSLSLFLKKATSIQKSKAFKMGQAKTFNTLNCIWNPVWDLNCVYYFFPYSFPKTDSLTWTQKCSAERNLERIICPAPSAETGPSKPRPFLTNVCPTCS